MSAGAETREEGAGTRGGQRASMGGAGSGSDVKVAAGGGSEGGSV